jgi:Zn-dependent peptidase ImmA (M78 family)
LFAAELLMPPTMVQKAVKDAARAQQVDIEDMARSFKVGRTEMEKRLRQLGLLTKEMPRM